MYTYQVKYLNIDKYFCTDIHGSLSVNPGDRLFFIQRHQ